jgi:hypothetical protein
MLVVLRFQGRLFPLSLPLPLPLPLPFIEAASAVKWDLDRMHSF